MRPSKLLILLFLLNASNVFAHQDFWMIKTFGNVKVRIKTGFNYEEINKAWIIGELTNKFANTLKYKDTIFLDFNHHYTGDVRPDYFISYDDGSIKQTWSGAETLYFLRGKALVIREVARRFDATATLKLVEYAIKNLSAIKQQQKPLEYNKNYCQWLINSIDTSKAQQVVKNNLSKLALDVMNNKIYRPKSENGSNNISYFFKNNRYHIFYNDYKVKDSVLLAVDNIYQFETISFNEATVLDTDSTFYYVQGVNNPHASNHWTIKNKFDYYKPYEITRVGTSKVAFSFWYYSKEGGRQPKERTLVYRSDKNELIQDIDKLLDNSYFR
jgi:hypothetical protein